MFACTHNTFTCEGEVCVCMYTDVSMSVLLMRVRLCSCVPLFPLVDPGHTTID